MLDPFYDHNADEEEFKEDDREAEQDSFRENTPEENAHVADIFERNIYGDDLP